MSAPVTEIPGIPQGLLQLLEQQDPQVVQTLAHNPIAASYLSNDFISLATHVPGSPQANLVNDLMRGSLSSDPVTHSTETEMLHVIDDIVQLMTLLAQHADAPQSTAFTSSLLADTHLLESDFATLGAQNPSAASLLQDADPFLGVFSREDTTIQSLLSTLNPTGSNDPSNLAQLITELLNALVGEAASDPSTAQTPDTPVGAPTPQPLFHPGGQRSTGPQGTPTTPHVPTNGAKYAAPTGAGGNSPVGSYVDTPAILPSSMNGPWTTASVAGRIVQTIHDNWGTSNIPSDIQDLFNDNSEANYLLPGVSNADQMPGWERYAIYTLSVADHETGGTLNPNPPGNGQQVGVLSTTVGPTTIDGKTYTPQGDLTDPGVDALWNGIQIEAGMHDGTTSGSPAQRFQHYLNLTIGNYESNQDIANRALDGQNAMPLGPGGTPQSIVAFVLSSAW